MSDLIVSSSSLSSLYSVAIETLCFVVCLLMALRYKQWKQPDGKHRPSQSQQSGAPLKASRPGASKATASAFKNRKAGNNPMAHGYLSGESTDTGTSNTEVSSSEFAGEACPVWLSAANGQQQLGFIQYPQAFMMTGAPDQNAFYNNRLSSHAQPFVPTTGANTGHGEYPANMSHSDLAAVVNKLSPQDAATVMASLNAASSMDATASMGHGVPVVLYPHPVARAPSAATQRESNRQRHSPQTAQARNNGQLPVRGGPLTKATAATKDSVEGSTLKDNLRELSALDPRCVLLVRKISKLGLNSPQLLEIYFSQFGPVEKIFISHSIEKPQGRRSQPRWRPAALGFIAMKNAEDADAARARGGEQVVLDVTITVGSYADHFAAKNAAAGEETAEVEDGIEQLAD